MKLCKTFANNSSANIKLSKTQLHNIGILGGFLGRLLGPLLKIGLPLIGNVLKPLLKRVYIPLGLTAAASTTYAVIHEKMFRSDFTRLIISSGERNDILKIVKSLEELVLSTKAQSIKNNQKGGIIGMLLGTLDASLLGNYLTGKGIIIAGKGTIRASESL